MLPLLFLAASQESQPNAVVNGRNDRRTLTVAEGCQQRILQESEHRVKNMLTVVQAIAIQTAANSPDMATRKQLGSTQIAAGRCGFSNGSLDDVREELAEKARLGVRLLTPTMRSVPGTEAGVRLLGSLGLHFDETKREIGWHRESRARAFVGRATSILPS